LTGDRRSGDAALKVAAPARERVAELARYVLATLVSAAITLGVPVVLHEAMGVDERVAVAVALAIAFVVNFISTRVYVFKSVGNARAELHRFIAVSLAFRLGEYGLFLLLFSLGIVYYLAQFAVLILSFVLKFLTYRGFVYGRRSQTDAAP
jgi:putative flippase GtrA